MLQELNARENELRKAIATKTKAGPTCTLYIVGIDLVVDDYVYLSQEIEMRHSLQSVI